METNGAVKEETKVDVDELMKLKAAAETSLLEFTLNVKKINALGFNVAPQADNSLYIFKDRREAYGILLPQPKPGVNHAGQH